MLPPEGHEEYALRPSRSAFLVYDCQYVRVIPISTHIKGKWRLALRLGDEVWSWWEIFSLLIPQLYFSSFFFLRLYFPIFIFIRQDSFYLFPSLHRYFKAIFITFFCLALYLSF